MLLDTIKTYKNGTWQRAIYYKWNGTAWEVTSVYTPYYSYFNDANSLNHNAIPVVKTYKPTWWAQIYNEYGSGYVISNSANGSGSFRIGVKYGEEDIYSTLVGLPYSQIIADSAGKFGIAKIVCTSTYVSVGGYGFGRCDYYPSTKASMPSVGSYKNSFELGSWAGSWNVNMTFQDYQFDPMDITMFNGILNNGVRAFYFDGETDTRVCFEIQNISWQVTWAGK